MSKLNALKDKLSSFKNQLAEKADKIAFIKAWRERKSPSPTDSGSAKKSISIGSIYREGDTFTRLQVLLVAALGIVTVVSAASLAMKLANKLKTSSEHEKIKQEYTSGLADLQRKSMEKAEMLSLGQFTTNAYIGTSNGSHLMSIDLWIRVSDPAAASLVNSRAAVFHEKTMAALNDLYLEKVNLLTESGKDAARQKIRDYLGEALPKGHSVEEVFIQNLVMQ